MTRLDTFPAVMQFTEFSNYIGVNRLRHAPPRIIRQPPAVGGEDKVITKNQLHIVTNAKPQASSTIRLRFCIFLTPPNVASPVAPDYSRSSID